MCVLGNPKTMHLGTILNSKPAHSEKTQYAQLFKICDILTLLQSQTYKIRKRIVMLFMFCYENIESFAQNVFFFFIMKYSFGVWVPVFLCGVIAEGSIELPLSCFLMQKIFNFLLLRNAERIIFRGSTLPDNRKDLQIKVEAWTPLPHNNVDFYIFAYN